MDYQTKISNGHHAFDEPNLGLRHSIASFFHDLFMLAGLQWQLLLEDAREAARSSLILMAFAFGGGILLLCAIPVALLGIAHLVSQAGLTLAYSLLLVAGLAGAIGVAIAIYAGRRIQASLAVFHRSQAEFQRNVAWLKKVTTRERSTTGHQDSDLYY